MPSCPGRSGSRFPTLEPCASLQASDSRNVLPCPALRSLGRSRPSRAVCGLHSLADFFPSFLRGSTRFLVDAQKASRHVAWRIMNHPCGSADHVTSHLATCQAWLRAYIFALLGDEHATETHQSCSPGASAARPSVRNVQQVNPSGSKPTAGRAFGVREAQSGPRHPLFRKWDRW